MQEHSNIFDDQSQSGLVKTFDQLTPSEVRFATGLINEIKQWKAERQQKVGLA